MLLDWSTHTTYKLVLLRWNRCVVGVADIDHMNILQAALKAMEGAVAALPSSAPDYMLVDGNQLPKGFSRKCSQTVVRGDSKSTVIAAASILAKACCTDDLNYCNTLQAFWHLVYGHSVLLWWQSLSSSRKFSIANCHSSTHHGCKLLACRLHGFVLNYMQSLLQTQACAGYFSAGLHQAAPNGGCLRG